MLSTAIQAQHLSGDDDVVDCVLLSLRCPGNASSTRSGNGELAGRNSVWAQWTRSCTYEGLFPLYNYTDWGLCEVFFLLTQMGFSCGNVSLWSNVCILFISSLRRSSKPRWNVLKWTFLFLYKIHILL